MKIVTVNVPESYVSAIEHLVGEDGFYPSRSELIRVAVREFLIKELSRVKNAIKFAEPEAVEDLDDETMVRVPMESLKDQPIREFKTYKILRRLE